MTNLPTEKDDTSVNVTTDDTPEPEVTEHMRGVKSTTEAETVVKDSVIVKEQQKENEVIRVMLWTAPRSLSTAFERCMTRVPNAKIFNEMYCAAFLLGPQRKIWWWPKLAPKHSYKHCKERLEAEHADYDFVFAKDFALEIHKRPEMLPKGYQHTFLIREPLKVFSSLRKTLSSSIVIKYGSLGAKIQRCFPTEGYFYEDMWELYSYLEAHPEDYPVPIILDADDIIKDPEGMVKKYCETIGLPFDPKIMNWEKAEFAEMPWEQAKFFRIANWMSGCYKNALNSTGFIRGGHKKNENKSKTPKTSLQSNVVDVERTSAKANVEEERLDVNEAVIGDDACDVASVVTENTVHTLEGQSKEAFIQQGGAGVAVGGNSDAPLSNTADGAANIPDPDMTGMHSDVQKAVKHSMPFYRLLYARRVVLDKIPRINPSQH